MSEEKRKEKSEEKRRRDGIGEMVRGQITMDWTLVSLGDV